MLESMIDHATPTRAEASDVANAVYDGADCVMLSGETAIGRHPDEAVKTMARICRATEAAPRTGTVHRLQVAAAAPGKKAAADRRDISRAVVDAALVLLDESEAIALWVFTESGRTARLVSKLRPRKPVYAFSPHQATLRYLSGMWGIHPLQVAQVKSTDEMVAAGEEAACRHRCGRPGDRVIVLAGQAPTVGATDLIKIHAIR
jgi:pyruvate kinase